MGNLYVKGNMSVKIPDLRFKFGNAILVFEGVKEMEESKIMSELWDVTIQIKNAMRKSNFVKTNKDGDIVSVLHRDYI